MMDIVFVVCLRANWVLIYFFHASIYLSPSWLVGRLVVWQLFEQPAWPIVGGGVSNWSCIFPSLEPWALSFCICIRICISLILLVISFRQPSYPIVGGWVTGCIFFPRGGLQLLYLYLYLYWFDLYFHLSSLVVRYWVIFIWIVRLSNSSWVTGRVLFPRGDLELVVYNTWRGAIH